MTATTPPRSTRRMSLRNSPELIGRLTAASDVFVAGKPLELTLRAALPAALPDEQTFADRTAAADDDVLRDLIVQDMRCGQGLVLSTGSGWSGGRLEAWTVDWSPEGQRLLSYPGKAVSKADFDTAVAAVAVDEQRWLHACAHAEEPHFGLAAFFGVIVRDKAGKSVRYTLAVLDAVAQVTMLLVNRLKLEINVPRPTQYVPPSKAVPLLPVPGTSSYPGGHAAVMAAVLAVLPELVAPEPAQLRDIEAFAAEITLEREAMGLHTAVDSEAGTALGKAFGGALLKLATQTPPLFPPGPWRHAFLRAQREW